MPKNFVENIIINFFFIFGAILAILQFLNCRIKISFMKYIMLSLVFMLSFFKMEMSAEESIKIFPQDTMQQFIEMHGKDSLIKLLDARITRSLDFVYRDWESLKISKETIPLLLMSKHYGLGIDTLPNDDRFYFGDMVVLYGHIYGDTSEVMNGYREVVKQSKEKKMTLKDYCINELKVDYSLRETAIPTAQLCHLIDAKGFCGEVMNNYFKNNSKYLPLEANIDLLLYVATVMRDDDYSNNPDVLVELKEHMETFYNSFNFTSMVMSVSLYKKAENDYFIHGTYVASLLNNYLLYAGVFDSPNQGRDLFYMLSLYNSNDGGFYSYLNTNTNRSDVLFTMYTIWAFNQWKEYLSKN